MSGLFFSRCSLLPIFHFYFDSLQEKLYAQLCYVTYLIDAIHPNNNFKQKLKVLLSEYSIVDVAAMGLDFPSHGITNRFVNKKKLPQTLTA